MTKVQSYTFIRKAISAIHCAPIPKQQLAFVRENQDQLRTEKYQGLTDHLQNEAQLSANLPVGRIVICPHREALGGLPRIHNKDMQLQNQHSSLTVKDPVGRLSKAIQGYCEEVG